MPIKSFPFLKEEFADWVTSGLSNSWEVLVKTKNSRNISHLPAWCLKSFTSYIKYGAGGGGGGGSKDLNLNQKPLSICSVVERTRTLSTLHLRVKQFRFWSRSFQSQYWDFCNKIPKTLNLSIFISLQCQAWVFYNGSLHMFNVFEAEQLNRIQTEPLAKPTVLMVEIAWILQQ